MSKRTLALIAASFVAVFYGANYTIAKDVMPHYIEPFGFIVIRVFGAFLLFWGISFLGPKEKIIRKDFLRIALAALFGVGINMLAFFEGLNLTTPINASVLMVTAPILVLVLATIFLKEKIRVLKVLGVLVGLSGALLIILYGTGSPDSATNPTLGNFLVFINAASYACYIIIVKKITQKYHPFTFMKWMYGIGFLFVLPFGFSQLLEIEPNLIPIEGFLKIGYVIVFATFGTYVLNIFAIRELKPTTVAVFIYLQPLLASVFAIGLGKDKLDLIKIIATLLIFVGVYLVTKKPKSLV
ncbi:DMT family transporter [Aquimarina muelleri]|uniref:Multidrug transporter n=1 Tax=Aquimarina muelleri TaxID=279356 RepID=A0A918N3B1_9FLAO|nr:DMT family transporter [Aquimarina muelleri]MCX2762800.1 DMT family transporter [Aquimarina muelleri]GGX11868.1 multidrug transporter [Aquimarina muelleri]